jgi:hypothetical protein
VATNAGQSWWDVYPTPVFTEPFANPTVIKEDHEFKMWFTSRGDAPGIGYATSPDGYTWTKRGLSLPAGPAGSPDSAVDGATVVRDGAVLKMWYSALGPGGGIGYATSP